MLEVRSPPGAYPFFMDEAEGVHKEEEKYKGQKDREKRRPWEEKK